MKKKVALVGASGFVGSKLLVELTNRGYSVVAIARDSSRIEKLPNVECKAINVNHLDLLTKGVQGCDAVISAFSPSRLDRDDLRVYEEYLHGAQHIQEATNKAGIKRYIFVGGAGSLYLNNIQLVDHDDFPAELKVIGKAGKEYLSNLKIDKHLDWTYFSPAIEMNSSTSGERRGKFKTLEKNPVFDDSMRSLLSAEDAAAAIVDELENNKYIRKQFTAGY